MGEPPRGPCRCLEILWHRLFGGIKDSDTENGRDPPDGEAAKREQEHPALQTEDVATRTAAVGPRVPTKPPKRAQESKIYTALWSFEARDDDELSFNAGDLFTVSNRTGEWWMTRKIDKNGHVLATGIVPQNYLARGESLDAQLWYFGKLNRFEAQSLLLDQQNQEGAYLVRLSEKDAIGHVLSVRSGGTVKHFRIFQEDSVFYLEPGHSSTSLIDLVEFYQTHCFNTINKLGKPCKKPQPQPQDLSHSTVDEWELPKEEFTLGEQLGSGCFAEVHRGRWKNHISVAIKIIKNDSDLNHSEFQREVQILKKLRHRHLISLFAVCTASSPYYIITELMEKGNLLNFLRGPEGGTLEMNSLIDMGAQVADGMSYLEENNSIHRDLAARNVLVGQNNICKVADFGLARIIKAPFYVTMEKKIPYKWTAPEAISHGMFSTKSDVWSFGILLFEIITRGGLPYPVYNNQEVVEKVSEGYRMPAPKDCPEFLYDIMLDCWNAKAADRPNFKDLKHSLVNNYRYETD